MCFLLRFAFVALARAHFMVVCTLVFAKLPVPHLAPVRMAVYSLEGHEPKGLTPTIFPIPLLLLFLHFPIFLFSYSCLFFIVVFALASLFVRVLVRVRVSVRPPNIGPDGRTVFDHKLSYRRSDSPENFNQRETFIVEMASKGGGGDEDDDGDGGGRDPHRNPSAEYLMAFDSQMQSAIAAMDTTLQKQQASGGADDDVPFVRTRARSPQVSTHTILARALSIQTSHKALRTPHATHTHMRAHEPEHTRVLLRVPYRARASSLFCCCRQEWEIQISNWKTAALALSVVVLISFSTVFLYKYVSAPEPHA